MKLCCLALLLTGVWMAAVVIIDHTIGIHSTPGIWAIILGFPGVMVAAWIAAWIPATESSVVPYIIEFVVNFNFYLLLIAGAVTVRRRFSKRSGVE